jgi:hypothetical protein
MSARWTTGESGAEDGWSADSADDQHAEWLEKWAPACPIGNPQRLCTLVGYREREPRRLQLRALVRPSIDGICEAIVEEDEHTVHVRVLACSEESDEDDDNREFWNCPVHVHLEKPLNGRKVIDVDSEQALPLFVPTWERDSQARPSPAPRTP